MAESYPQPVGLDFQERVSMSLADDLKEILNDVVDVRYQSIDELTALLSTERSIWQKMQAFPYQDLSPSELDEVRVRFSGKRSPLQNFLKSLKNLMPEERKLAGSGIQELKVYLEDEVSQFVARCQNYFEEKRLEQENDDVTLPLPVQNIGSRHPISVVMEDLLEPFRRMGFSVVDGPEIDSDFYNFEALNMSHDHPAREMQDTFFLSSEWVLRTHTSNVQIHALLERGAPLKIVCPGCVYRNEFDMTHVPSFRQIECLVVDKGIHMGHLRHMIHELLQTAFGRAVNIRLRSSYFPFTEPSAEVDVQCQQCLGQKCRSCKYTGWCEIGGCGLVNRKVLEHCHIDPEVYSGIAFGFGVDRIAKDRYAIADLRSLFEGNVSFSKSFGLV